MLVSAERATVRAGRTGLPAPSSPLIGRDAEVSAIGAQLLRQEVRLLTLIGPAGVGKTRLALAVATAMLEHFADGGVFVDLAPIVDPRLVLARISEAVGVRPATDQPPLARLSAALREKQQLLIVDNCEHVLAAGSELAALLAACSALKILATSRAPLRLRGEQELPVPPLSDKSAIRLFMDRAHAIRPDLAFNDAARQTVERICRRLDGLPLAIELAAARCRVLEPGELFARLGESLPLLTGGELDSPPRHRTLRAALTWSHELLSQEEKALFRRLAVFVGAFSLAAAETVCGWDDVNVLDTLESLVRWSLVGREAGRFRMLQTIREFALEQMTGADDHVLVCDLHARWCLEVAERAMGQLSGPGEAEERQRLVAEQDDMRAALGWTLAVGRAELGLRLASAHGQFWITGGQLEEGRAWLCQLLAVPGSSAGPIRTRALCAAGAIATWQDDRAEAHELLEEALADAHTTSDLGGAADALGGLELLACRAHDDAASVAFAEEALALRRLVGDEAAIASALSTLGRASASAGDAARASLLYQESLAIRRRLADRFGAAEVLSFMGRDGLRRGEFAAARAQCEEALAIFREFGVRVQIAWALLLLGGAARGENDTRGASTAYQEGLELCAEMSAPLWVAVALAGLGGVALDQRHLERAARLLGAAERLRATVGVFPQIWDSAIYERDLSMVRTLLGDRGATMLGAGQALTLEEAVRLGLSPQATSGRSQGDRGPLTVRELEVAVLVAQGLTNRQIAVRLVISNRTAGNHVEHILDKLRVGTRAQIAAWAVERGLAGAASAATSLASTPPG